MGYHERRPRFGRGATRALVALALISFGNGASAADQKMETITVTDIRGMLYCEVLLIFADRVDVYNTTASNGCPQDKWQAMDVAALAAEYGARAAQLNGPKYWAADAQTVDFGETRTFGGIDARYAASLPIATIGSGEGADPYVGFTSTKKQTLVFEAGAPIYELVDPDGRAFVLNAYGAKVKDGDPANLADQLSPAEGWAFRVTTPSEEVVIAASMDAPVQMVGDDLRQYYTLFPAGE